MYRFQLICYNMMLIYHDFDFLSHYKLHFYYHLLLIWETINLIYLLTEELYEKRFLIFKILNVYLATLQMIITQTWPNVYT